MCAGADLFDDVVPVVVQVDADDLVARHHDVVDGDLFQVQDVHQHALVPFGNEHAGFVHQRAELLGLQRVVGSAHAALTKQPQHRVRQRVGHQHQRIQHFQHGHVNKRCREGDPLGVPCRQRLWRDLGENQHHQHQQRSGNCNAGFAVQPQGDHRRQRRGRQVDRIVAEQDQPDETVRALEQARRKDGTAVPGLCQVAQAVAVQRHQRGFRTREEARE